MRMKNKIKILLVEDDTNLSMVLQDYLEMIGYDTVLEKDGEAGLIAFNKDKFDLCILDVMMPKKDGFSLAKDIRALNTHIPIIFLTAKTLKEDRIAGFKVGGDDYITKPFSTEELSLRISAILKRVENQYIKKQGPDIIKLGAIDFDYRNLILIHKGEKYSLTKKEAALLRLLAENKNELVERDYALEKIWGTSDYFIGRSMDVFIAKLRKILKLDPHIAIINVHGTGFKLEVAD